MVRAMYFLIRLINELKVPKLDVRAEGQHMGNEGTELSTKLRLKHSDLYQSTFVHPRSLVVLVSLVVEKQRVPPRVSGTSSAGQDTVVHELDNSN